MVQGYGAAILAHWHSIMAIVTVVAIRLFVASVVDRVGDSALDRLRKNLLNLLGDNGGIAAILGVCLGGRLVGLAAGGVDLEMHVSHIVVPKLNKRAYLIGKSLLEAGGCGLLDLSGDGRLAGCVGLALSVLVGGRHSDAVAEDWCCSEACSCEGAELECCRHDDGLMDLIDNEEVPFMYGHAGLGASCPIRFTSSLQLLMSSCGGESTRILRRDSGVVVTQGWTEQLSACNDAVIV